MADLVFRAARPEERPLLDDMTLAGVRYWQHDTNFPEAYQGLVSMLEEAPFSDRAAQTVIESDGEVVGFFELVDHDDHVELMRMFQRIDHIGSGLGRLMWDQALITARGIGERMKIVSDPGAVGFYAHMGAVKTGEFEGTPGFVLTEFWVDLT